MSTEMKPDWEDRRVESNDRRQLLKTESSKNEGGGCQSPDMGHFTPVEADGFCL